MELGDADVTVRVVHRGIDVGVQQEVRDPPTG